MATDRPAPADLRDPGCFARVFADHAAMVHGTALVVLRDPLRAEDVVQDVFLRLWRRPEAFDPARGDLAAFLRLMARSRAVDLWREAQARDRARRRVLAAHGPRPGAAPPPRPELRAAARGHARRRRPALGRARAAARRAAHPARRAAPGRRPGLLGRPDGGGDRRRATASRSARSRAACASGCTSSATRCPPVASAASPSPPERGAASAGRPSPPEPLRLAPSPPGRGRPRPCRPRRRRARRRRRAPAPRCPAARRRRSAPPPGEHPRGEVVGVAALEAHLREALAARRRAPARRRVDARARGRGVGAAGRALDQGPVAAPSPRLSPGTRAAAAATGGHALHGARRAARTHPRWTSTSRSDGCTRGSAKRLGRADARRPAARRPPPRSNVARRAAAALGDHLAAAAAEARLERHGGRAGPRAAAGGDAVGEVADLDRRAALPASRSASAPARLPGTQS